MRLSGGHSLHETSSVIVETVTKTSKMAGAYSSLSSSQTTSDASKVVCHGAGLSKAFVGQKNNFSVDCSKAGKIKPKKVSIMVLSKYITIRDIYFAF